MLQPSLESILEERRSQPHQLIETLQDVLPGIRSKIIVDEQTSGILPLLDLNAPKGGGS